MFVRKAEEVSGGKGQDQRLQQQAPSLWEKEAQRATAKLKMMGIIWFTYLVRVENSFAES
jgi:hypothetical protein